MPEVMITHAISQQSLIEHDNDLGNLAYTLHAHLIPRSLPFCPVFKPPLRLPMIYSARIESNGDYGLLDEHGRFKVRSLFDTRDKDEAAHTEASHPIRTMSFHGGPGGDNTVGASIPFRDDVEVIWSNIDGDANRPVILGAVPDPNTTSPVTSNNFGDNIIRTGSRNELLFHDIKDQEHIELKQGDYDQPFNLLRLDANCAGHLVKFASTLGAMQVYAKQTLKTEAGDSITQTHGNDRTETVENSHKLTTKNKEIHYQSATDQTHQASQNITHKADKNIEHRAEGSTQWRVARDAAITIRQGDQIIKIDNGSLKIQAGNGISIKGKGGGSIKIGQNGAGIEMDPAGNVKLYGKTVTINGANGTKLKGNINQSIGGGGSLSGTALAPLAVSEIPKLSDPGVAAITDLFIEPEIVPVGTSTKLLFNTKHFKGGEAATITVYKYPDGDETRKAVVDTLSATLPDGMGQIELPWTAPADSATDDTADSGQAAKGPDEYRFEVKIGSTSSEKPSTPLWLTRDVEIQAQYDDGTALPDGATVRIAMADGRHRYAKAKGGSAHFAEVLVGVIQREIVRGTHEGNKNG